MKTSLALVALILFLAPAQAAADGTAKSGLAQAIQLGKKWQPDAVLTSIGTPGADANGKSRLWQYDFYSKKTKGCARVNLPKDQEPFIHRYPSCVAGKPISAEFVDSPAAIDEAKRNGFKPGDLVNITLDHSKDRLLKPGRECWTISSEHDFDRAKAVTRGWGVGPKTGKFIMRLSGER